MPHCIEGPALRRAPALPPAGCDGVAGSGKVNDECGECGGPGKNADGCCGGQAKDACGVCGGPGKDACGICGGSGLNAAGCCGGQSKDACGVCGGPGKDACGICGGSGLNAAGCCTGSHVVATTPIVRGVDFWIAAGTSAWDKLIHNVA
eukprot:gene28224-9868_t